MMQIEESTVLESKNSITRTELTTLPSLPASTRGESSPLASELAYWLTTPAQTVIGTNATASSASSEVRQNQHNSRENGAASTDVNILTSLLGEELLQTEKTPIANTTNKATSQEGDSDDNCSTVPGSPVSSEGRHITTSESPLTGVINCISDDEYVSAEKPLHKSTTKSHFFEQTEFKQSIPIVSADIFQQGDINDFANLSEVRNDFVDDSKIREQKALNNQLNRQNQLLLNDDKLSAQIVKHSSVNIKCQDENESTESSSTESEDTSDASSSSDISESLTSTSSSVLPTNNKSDNEIDIADCLQNETEQPQFYTNLYQEQQFNEVNDFERVIENNTESETINKRVTDADFYIVTNGNTRYQGDNKDFSCRESDNNALPPLYQKEALADNNSGVLTGANLSTLPLEYKPNYEFSIEQVRFEEPTTAVPIETLVSLNDIKSEEESTLLSVRPVETTPTLNTPTVDKQGLQTDLFWNQNGSDTQTATSFCEDFVAVPHRPANVPREPIAAAEPIPSPQNILAEKSNAPNDFNSGATQTSYTTENLTCGNENSTVTPPQLPKLLPANIWPILIDQQKARIVHELSVYESLLLQKEREQQYFQDGSSVGEENPIEWDLKNLNEAEVFVWLEQQKQRQTDNNNIIGEQTVQMGIENWFSTLRNLLFNRSNHASEPENSLVDRALKRRSTNLQRSDQPHPIKYRRVDNTFPKIINTIPTADLNDDGYMPIGVAYNSMSKQNFVPRHSSASNNDSSNRPKLQSSFLGAPHTMRRSLPNQPVCEIDLSDDDDDLYNKIVEQNIRGTNIKSGSVGISAAVNGDNFKQSKVYNVHVERTSVNERSAPPPPPLLVPDDNDWLTRPFQRITHGNMNHTDYLRCSSSLSSHETPTAGSGRTNNNWSLAPLRVVSQVREIDERAQYLRLLQQYEPQVYGGPENDLAQRRVRHSNQYAKPRVSDIGASMVVNNSCFGTLPPPLSSTINIDDVNDEMTEVRKFVIEVDSDDDIENVENIVQHSNAKSSHVNKAEELDSRAQQQPQKHQHQQAQAQESTKRVTTIDLIDDEFEDVIDLSGCDDQFDSKGAINSQPEQNTTNNANSQKVTPVNSLKARLLSCDLMKSNWSSDFAQKWNRINENKVQDLKYLEEQISIVAAEREKKTHEALTRRLMSIKFNDKPYVDLEDLDYANSKQDKLLPITDEHRNLLQKYLSSPSNKVLVSKFNLNITRDDIVTLLGINWLNDEVINFYMNLLTERSEQKPDALRVYAMNTFFIPRLLQGGHAAVRRWTRKVDIFARDVIPVPVHVGGVHWCMAIIHLREKSIKYYDSMGKPNPGVLRALEMYLQEESLDKRKVHFDTSDFRIESVADSPRQANGSDCGVFSCMTAEYITRGRPITFSQANMEYFRQKMILEIVGGKLWN